MKQRHFLRRWVGLGTGLAVALSANAANAQPKEYIIGAPVALTGTYAWVGVPSREGMDVAIAELNESGYLGTDKLKVIVEDTGSEKSQVVALINRFASRDKALMILGPSSSVEGIAAAPVANDLKIPMLSPTAVSDRINKAGPWSFRMPASPSAVSIEVCNYAVKKLGTKSVALVVARDNDGAVAQHDAALKCFKEHGVNVVFDDSVLAADSDFLALQSKMIGSKPQALFMALGGEQAGNFAVQARQNGIDAKVQFMGGPAMGAGQFLTIGGGAVEGTIYPADYFAGLAGNDNKRFVAAYEKRFNRQPDFGAALGYSAVKMAAAVIKSSGSDPTREQIRAALQSIKDQASIVGSGRFSFDQDRGGTYTPVILRVKNGKIVAAE
ncbi:MULTISPECIES: ABC transporter substrate-binding protein [unclassified Variovorax]|uniref:ABC transporter substrate-binding protein n=1 Tax=unclassified Variovorax TaxID=663243 RepID=UPI001BD31939|nr:MULTISPECIES: ABC transporter substrate-binding protein [unclassified Variovorax]